MKVSVGWLAPVTLLRARFIHRLRLYFTAAVASVLFIGNPAFSSTNFDQMRRAFKQIWGGNSVSNFDDWHELIKRNSSADELTKLSDINKYFNTRIQFSESIENWSDNDFWATPIETLGRQKGHCTSYAIAKYYSLKLSGIERKKLRLVYVREKPGGKLSSISTAHMVVAYYVTPESEPLFLDNLINSIRPASRRPDLVPVFSFNEDGIFTNVLNASSDPIAGITQYSRWESFLKKASMQGFQKEATSSREIALR